MQTTSNYNFLLPEGTDLVNLLTDSNPNWTALDGILLEMDERSVANCTEVVTLGVHAISRLNTHTKLLKWIATANFTAGDTFTVDGNLIPATTPAGSALATGAYVTGAVVIACLNADDSAMTIFVSGTNVASDSQRLGGELPSYYATDADMDDVQTDITNINNWIGNNSIVGIGDGSGSGAIAYLNTVLNNLIKEGAMPKLDYGTPLYTFSDSNLTYTATKKCYLVGEVRVSVSASQSCSISLDINGKQYGYASKLSSTSVSAGAGSVINVDIKPLDVGDIVTLTKTGTGDVFYSLHVLDVVS